MMAHLQLIRRPLASNASAHPLDVLKAKAVFATLGHYEAPEWGLSEFPDPALYGAITRFQKAHRLKTDGVMKPGGETEQALLSTLTVGQSVLAIRAAAQAIQNMGRGGDELLVHITPDEARLLDAVTDGGSINPNTGLLEFFWNSDGGWDSKNDPDRNETMRDVERQFDRELGLNSFGGSKDRGWGSDRDTNRAPSDPTSQSNNAQRMLEEKPKQHPARAKNLLNQPDEGNAKNIRARQLEAQINDYDHSFTAGFFERKDNVKQPNGAWQKSVAKQTGYNLTPAGYREGGKYMSPIGSALEKSWDVATETYDRLTNPNRTTMFDKKYTTMTPKMQRQVAKEIGVISGLELTGGGLKIGGAIQKDPLIGGALDQTGDGLLGLANQKKRDWGYRR